LNVTAGAVIFAQYTGRVADSVRFRDVGTQISGKRHRSHRANVGEEKWKWKMPRFRRDTDTFDQLRAHPCHNIRHTWRCRRRSLSIVTWPNRVTEYFTGFDVVAYVTVSRPTTALLEVPIIVIRRRTTTRASVWNSTRPDGRTRISYERLNATLQCREPPQRISMFK